MASPESLSKDSLRTLYQRQPNLDLHALSNLNFKSHEASPKASSTLSIPLECSEGEGALLVCREKPKVNFSPDLPQAKPRVSLIIPTSLDVHIEIIGSKVPV